MASLLAYLVRGRRAFHWTLTGTLCLVLSIAAWLLGLCCLLAGIACGGERGTRPGDETGQDTVEIADRGSVSEAESPADTMVMQARGVLSGRPVAPLRIDGACPFECCTYGDWTTTGETTLYEEPDPESARWTVPPGTPLEAMSGFVILTEIGTAIAGESVRLYTEDGAERRATAGDTLFLLDNVGEGYRRVWHRGSILQTDAVSGFVAEGGLPAAEILVEPREEWWALARSPDGRAGWLWMDRTPRMESADACG
ncbi:MAG TPA: hypothetical protein VJ788_02870 [Gemmatimonadota bacterium]|nr:hypothetical protein [Gemmatimonadota bacterium]